jgi:hypothetical protein
MRRKRSFAKDAVDAEVVSMAAGSEGDEAHTVIPLPGPITDKAEPEKEPKKILSFPATKIQKTIFEFPKRSMRDDYQRIYFVSRATDKDEVTRPFCTIIHVEPSESYGCRIIATEGKRLHLAELEYELPPGDYEFRTDSQEAVLKGPIGYEIQYPNYQGIIFKNQKYLYNLDFGNTGLGKNASKNLEMTRHIGRLVRRSNILINLRYLDDLVKLEWSVYVDADKESRAVIFKTKTPKELFAVLMPFDDNDDDYVEQPIDQEPDEEEKDEEDDDD